MASQKDVPHKAPLPQSPLWETSIDARLLEVAELETSDQQSEQSPSAEWLAQVIAEQGAHPPVDLCAEHYASMNDMDQNVFFGQLNDSCGYGYAEAVVTAAKKKSPE